MQCLQYGNKLLVSRASNINGASTQVNANPTTAAVLAATATPIIPVTDGTAFAVGDIIASEVSVGGGVDMTVQYEVVSIAVNDVTVDRNIAQDILVGSAIFKIERSANAIFEAVSTGGVTIPAADYFNNMQTIENSADYEAKEVSLAMTSVDSKVKFIAKNPGAWGNNLEIAIANPALFSATVPTEAFTGIALDDLFDYAPTGTEIGIVIRDGNSIVETFTVDFDVTAKDSNNKSTYIETVINAQSNYVYAKDNTANTAAIEDYCAVIGGVTTGTLTLIKGADSAIQADDLLNAYNIFDNKEALDELRPVAM